MDYKVGDPVMVWDNGWKPAIIWRTYDDSNVVWVRHAWSNRYTAVDAFEVRRPTPTSIELKKGDRVQVKSDAPHRENGVPECDLSNYRRSLSGRVGTVWRTYEDKPFICDVDFDTECHDGAYENVSMYTHELIKLDT